MSNELEGLMAYGWLEVLSIIRALICNFGRDSNQIEIEGSICAFFDSRRFKGVALCFIGVCGVLSFSRSCCSIRHTSPYVDVYLNVCPDFNNVRI